MKKIEYIIDELVDQYLYADESDRPWIIGFSGGKDSTVLLQLVWKALEQVKEIEKPKRSVYVVCNDTMVENPIIANYVKKVLTRIGEAAVEQGMPVYVKQTFPRLEDSFWVNLIGRGYPAPNNKFRWCTDRLKINPTSKFITSQVSAAGDALVLIGTRIAESVARAQSIKKHSVRGKRITRHPTQRNTFIYAPIKQLSLEEVWYVINSTASPWGADNEELFTIYAEASADDYECPTMVTNKNHSSCGQSRFGCWVCTVVKEDKSMAALVDNGKTWLAPLLELRNAIVEERNLEENRMDTRRNGQKVEKGKGSYTPDYRASLLKRLLEAQKKIQQTLPGLELIANQELMVIQTVWYSDGIFKHKVSDILRRVNGLIPHTRGLRKKEEEEMLKSICKTEDIFQLIRDHLALVSAKSLLKRKHGLRRALEIRVEAHIKAEKC